MATEGKRHTRRYSPKRLSERPVEIQTCAGVVVVTAEVTEEGHLRVCIEEPTEESVPQPSPQ